jgi:hypothetical protein
VQHGSTADGKPKPEPRSITLPPVAERPEEFRAVGKTTALVFDFNEDTPQLGIRVSPGQARRWLEQAEALIEESAELTRR